MSFAKAAEELFVTPAALSYQIKQLEEYLAIPLFVRLNRAVELTEAGRALQPGVSDGFDSLRQATRAVVRMRDDAALTITAGPAFTAKWLAPRFFSFANAYPDIELRFVATLRVMDFQRDGVDAAVRFGHEVMDNEYGEVLAEEWMTPVCTPAIAEQIARKGIGSVTLLHDESIEFLDRPPTWQAWSMATGIDVDWTHGQHFTNADHAIDFALEGGGVVLGRVVLVERYLETGRMVAPFQTAMRAGAEYRFVCPKGAETTPRIATLLKWFGREVAGVSKHAEGMTFVDVPGT